MGRSPASETTRTRRQSQRQAGPSATSSRLILSPATSGFTASPRPTLGLAAVAFVIGSSIALASGGTGAVPDRFWVFGNTLVGALLGLLVPSPESRESGVPPVAATGSRWWRWTKATARWLVHSIAKNRVFVALLFVFVFSTIYGDHGHPELLAVAGASGGALLGLLIPSPVRHAPPPAQ